MSSLTWATALKVPLITLEIGVGDALGLLGALVLCALIADLLAGWVVTCWTEREEGEKADSDGHR